jgi:serine/threonine-protein kinase
MVDDARTVQDATVVPAGSVAVRVELPPAGYDFGEVIGKGGMGEVIAAHDLRIGRDVAVKRMHAGMGDADAVSRFLREARIQARLDHPAIVPVHELGTDAEGRPYFTMKRLAGETLAQRLSTGGRMQPLLRAFIDVCLAVELAHTRGVVHRDLKPANIILGNFGEVYVLDWGIARVIAEHDERVDAQAVDTVDENTQTGAILGTPGYMAPEQINGKEVTGATDVYALGAILFEILAAAPLHPRGTTPALAHTLAQPQLSPAALRPDVAPELDAACFGALAADPKSRPTARALAESVQRYLDVDRDAERRRALAEERLAEARRAPDPGRAIYLAGQAVTLAPGYAEASELLLELFVTPPKVDPPELVASFEVERKRTTVERLRRGRAAYVSVFSFWAVIPFMHVASWLWLGVFYGTLAVIVGAMFWWTRRGADTNLSISISLTFVLVIAWSRIAGPFMLLPVMVCGVMVAFTADPRMSDNWWRTIGFVLVALLLPMALEGLGILAPTFGVADGAIVTHSQIFEIRGAFELAILTIANLAFVVAVAVFALGLNRAARTARDSLLRQTWALRQLLPRAARPDKT